MAEEMSWCGAAIGGRAAWRAGRRLGFGVAESCDVGRALPNLQKKIREIKEKGDELK